jgi:hypothetical protein
MSSRFSTADAMLGDAVMVGEGIGNNERRDGMEDGKLKPILELGGTNMLPKMDPRPRSGWPALVAAGSDALERSVDSTGMSGEVPPCASTLPNIEARPELKLNGRGSCCDDTTGTNDEGITNETVGVKLGTPNKLSITDPNPRSGLEATASCGLLEGVGAGALGRGIDMSSDERRTEGFGDPNRLSTPAPTPDIADASGFAPGLGVARDIGGFSVNDGGLNEEMLGTANRLSNPVPTPESADASGFRPGLGVARDIAGLNVSDGGLNDEKLGIISRLSNPAPTPESADASGFGPGLGVVKDIAGLSVNDGGLNDEMLGTATRLSNPTPTPESADASGFGPGLGVVKEIVGLSVNDGGLNDAKLGTASRLSNPAPRPEIAEATGSGPGLGVVKDIAGLSVNEGSLNDEMLGTATRLSNPTPTPESADASGFGPGLGVVKEIVGLSVNDGGLNDEKLGIASRLSNPPPRPEIADATRFGPGIVGVAKDIAGVSVNEGSLNDEKLGTASRLSNPAPRPETADATGPGIVGVSTFITELNVNCGGFNDKGLGRLRRLVSSSSPSSTPRPSESPIRGFLDVLAKGLGSSGVGTVAIDDTGGRLMEALVNETALPSIEPAPILGIGVGALCPRRTERFIIELRTFNGVGVICTGDPIEDGLVSVARVCSRRVDPEAIRGLEIPGSKDVAPKAVRERTSPKGKEVAGTTGTSAIMPFAPNRLPTVPVNPPTACCKTPCVPFNVHFRSTLSYVAPAQYGFPPHALRHPARVGVVESDKSGCRRFVLHSTWYKRPLSMVVEPFE